MNTSINRIKCQLLVLIICTLILSGIATQAQGINFETGDWASVQEQAKTTNKLIFLDIYTTWCGACKLMDKNIYNNKGVGDYFNSHFISYKLDAEKGEGLELSKKYAVTSYPDQLFIDANGKLLIRRAGKMDVKQMLEFGKKVMNSENYAKAMNSAYNCGNRHPEFMVKYLAFLKGSDLPTTEVLTNYLEMFDKDQLLLRDNLILINDYIHTPYNTVIEYLAAEREELANSLLRDTLIPHVLGTVYYRYLSHIIKQGSAQAVISKLLSHASLGFRPDELASFKFKAKIGIANRDKDWVNYAKYIITYVNTYCLDFPIVLNNYAYKFYEKEDITDPKALNVALGWINLALQSDKDNYHFLDTKVAVLYKLKRNEEALVTANKAVGIAVKSGGKGLSMLKFIEKIKAN